MSRLFSGSEPGSGMGKRLLILAALAVLPTVLLVTIALAAAGCPPPLPASAYATRCTGGRITLREQGRAVLYRDCPQGEHPARPMAGQILALVEKVRCRVGDRVVVTSGYRSATHNLYSWATMAPRQGAANPVSRKSRHVTGRAVDFYVRGFSHSDLLQLRTQLHAWAGRLERPLRGSREVIWSKVYRRNEGRDPDNLHPHPYIHIELRG